MWTKSKNELKNFMNYLSTKNSSIKFDFNYFKVKIEFLDTLVYIEQRQKLQTTLYQKPADSQNYLCVKFKHHYS